MTKIVVNGVAYDATPVETAQEGQRTVVVDGVTYAITPAAAPSASVVGNIEKINVNGQLYDIRDVEDVNAISQRIDTILAQLGDGAIPVGLALLADKVKRGAITIEMLQGNLQETNKVADNLTTDNTLNPLSARQGKILKELIDVINGNGEGSTNKKINDAITEFATKLTDNDSIDTFKEIMQWVAEHGKEFTDVVKHVNRIVDNAAQYDSLSVAAMEDSVDILVDKVHEEGVPAEPHTVTIPAATTESAGVMGAEDKRRLDNGIHEIGSDSIEGYFVGTTDITNSAFRATDYIPIIGYEYITILKGSYANGSYKCLCFYTDEKTLLTEGQQNSYNVGDKINIPEGACYVRAFIASYSVVGTSIIIGASVDSLRQSYVKTKYSLEDLKKEVDELQNKEENLVPINKAESMLAGFITANGTFASLASFVNTGYIDISRYKKAVIKTGDNTSYNNPQYHAIHYYDDKKNQIGYVDGFTANQELVFLDGAHYIAVFAQSYMKSITLHVPTEEFLLMQVASNTEAVDKLSIKEWEIIKPYFFAGIPKYIDVPVGDNSYIYLQNMSSIDLEFMPKASVAATVTKSYTDEAFTNEPLFTKYNSKVIAITPTSAQMTKMWITVKNNLFENTAEAILRIRGVQRQGGDGSTKNILIVGDSLIESGIAASCVFSELASDGDYVINKIGTLQNDVCEGRGSWSWSTYTNPLYETTPYNNYTNPFMNNGVLDFKNYMSVNYPSLQGIDITVISLGTNDMGQNGTGTTEEMQAKAVTAVGKAKIFIDALLRDYPNCKIALGLPSFGAKYSSNNLYAYGFARSIMLYNKLMVETFDNGIYHSNVTCVPQGLFIDRNNAYPHTDVEINGESHRLYNDFIHPTNIGLKEFGWAYYAKIRAILNGLL